MKITVYSWRWVLSPLKRVLVWLMEKKKKKMKESNLWKKKEKEMMRSENKIIKRPIDLLIYTFDFRCSDIFLQATSVHFCFIL